MHRFFQKKIKKSLKIKKLNYLRCWTVLTPLTFSISETYEEFQNVCKKFYQESKED